MAARYRVLVPARVSGDYLALPLYETAREALRLLADDPRPAWSEPHAGGRRLWLPDHSWITWVVDDDQQLVTVVGAGPGRGPSGR